ncbi:hypothetical protein [Streptomyces sp. NPDC051286]|uniref:hypothetical protein n=1 Tax=Streptomyces sp. NPDC051286 TaxID=3365647 RepID=UPI0037A343FA
MPNDQPSDAYRCGQLYAALAALEKLSKGERHSLGRLGARVEAAQQPRDRLTGHLKAVGEYVVDARKQGRGPAATAILRSLPDLLPDGRELPHKLNTAQQEEFCDGRHAQEKVFEHAKASR